MDPGLYASWVSGSIAGKYSSRLRYVEVHKRKMIGGRSEVEFCMLFNLVSELKIIEETLILSQIEICIRQITEMSLRVLKTVWLIVDGCGGRGLCPPYPCLMLFSLHFSLCFSPP